MPLPVLPGLLLDENLSPRPIDLLAGEFPGSRHVGAVGLQGRPDREIWLTAARLGLLRRRRPQIASFVADRETALLILDPSSAPEATQT